MRALVIDDSRVVRTILRNILGELRIDALEAANGQEGLDVLHSAPDVGFVLVDWNMPVMDGFEFIQAVRAQRAYDAIKLVMVTTETESEQLVRAMNAGANEYVMKPFTKEVLLAKLSLLDVVGE